MENVVGSEPEDSSLHLGAFGFGFLERVKCLCSALAQRLEVPKGRSVDGGGGGSTVRTFPLSIINSPQLFSLRMGETAGAARWRFINFNILLPPLVSSPAGSLGVWLLEQRRFPVENLS